MSVPLRWFTILLLLACLALTSGIVTCLNVEHGGWALLLAMCAIPLAFASLGRAGRRELLVTIGITLALAWTFHAARNEAHWRCSITVEHRTGTLTFTDERTYLHPASTPARIPFAGINDAWAILAVDDTPCTITWSNGTEREVIQASLKDFFAPRRQGNMKEGLHMGGLLILNALLLLLWLRSFFGKGFGQLGYRDGLAATFVIGVLVGSMISPPSTWLDNEFLSRPDDWLCYESGARAILRGNWSLMPAVGGVELWSLLYPPVIAMLHALLGPALGALYIVQFASYLLLVPLLLRLVQPPTPAFTFIVAAVTALFVGIDLELHYAWRLLSDVLPLLLLTALFIALQRQSDVRLLALLCGLLYLMRLEFIGLGPLLFGMLVLGPRRISSKERLHYLGVLLLCALPYFLRWYLLYGNLRPFPVAMEGTGHMPFDVLLSGKHLWLKFRAVCGDYAAINPAMRFRYHWLPVHAGFLLALLHTVRARRMDPLRAQVLVCFAYVLLTRMLSPSIGIYGHRHSLALVLLELVFIGLTLRTRQEAKAIVTQA